MNSAAIYILLTVLAHVSGFAKLPNDPIRITTTSSVEYQNKPLTSIYPAFVDGLSYQSWTREGSRPYYEIIADGGQIPYRWEVTKGKLPDGIFLNKNGRLEGKPTREGKFSFVVKVTDSRGAFHEKSLDFVVSPFRSKWIADARFGIWFPFGPCVEPGLYTKEDIKGFEERLKNFNADQWVAAVVDMGGKVLNCSVKAGDGIRMWPSTTPSTHELKMSRNIVKELILACHKKGIKFVGSFAPDHTWNKKVNDTGIDGTWGTLNKGLIKELVEMGVDGFWIDMGGTPELFGADVDPRWFPWDEILPMVRTMNPYVTFANNPGLANGGAVLRWPDTDILVYEGYVGIDKSALVTAKPSIVKKRVAIEVDNLLDNSWTWIALKKDRKPKSAEVIIENIKANWEAGATYMLDIPVRPDGEVHNDDYALILSKIGKFVKANQSVSRTPAFSLNGNVIYTGVQLISLSAIGNAKIYYTLDGSSPNEKSNEYVAPLRISKTTILKAISREPGKQISRIFSQTYRFQPNSLNVKNKTLITQKTQSPPPMVDVKQYYRGMRITVGPHPIVIDEIGRKYVDGNKNAHTILIKTLLDNYPVLTSEINTGTAKIDADGFQYIPLNSVKLKPGISYIISSKEDAEDQFVPGNFNQKLETENFRTVTYFILNPTGDPQPVKDDHIGSILNLRYHQESDHNPKNLALGCKAYLVDSTNKPLPAWMGRYYAEHAVDGDINTRAQAGGQYASTLLADLGQVKGRVKQVVIDFVPDSFATDFQLLSSPDNNKWSVLVHRSNNSDRHIVLNIKPNEDRYFKIRAIKPDGPNQKGNGMGILEFKLFE